MEFVQEQQRRVQKRFKNFLIDSTLPEALVDTKLFPIPTPVIEKSVPDPNKHDNSNINREEHKQKGEDF